MVIHSLTRLLRGSLVLDCTSSLISCLTAVLDGDAPDDTVVVH